MNDVTQSADLCRGQFLFAQRYGSRGISCHRVSVCLSTVPVCLSHAGIIVSKRLHGSSWFYWSMGFPRPVTLHFV